MITITQPINGSTVKGIVPVLVTAPGVAKINFYVDGVHKGTDSASPFRFDWYTTNYPDGTHTVKAVSGNGKQSASVAVTVQNKMPTLVGYGSAAYSGGNYGRT